METGSNSQEKPKFLGIVRPLVKKDLEELRPILETHIRTRGATGIGLLRTFYEKVDKQLEIISESLKRKTDQHYLVAESEKGIVLGVVGFRKLHEQLSAFAQTSKPAELVDYYLSDDLRFPYNQAVEHTLINKVVEMAKEMGFTEMIDSHSNSVASYEDFRTDHTLVSSGGEMVAIINRPSSEIGSGVIIRKEF